VSDDQGPWVLVAWDPDADDYRGEYFECGFYRNRETAEQIAAEHNAKIVARINAEATKRYERRMAEWKAFRRDAMPTPPTPLTSLDDIPEPKFPNARHGGKYSYPFMGVRPIEFEDD
jgi:hypothetical protein